MPAAAAVALLRAHGHSSEADKLHERLLDEGIGRLQLRDGDALSSLLQDFGLTAEQAAEVGEVPPQPLQVAAPTWEAAGPTWPSWLPNLGSWRVVFAVLC